MLYYVINEYGTNVCTFNENIYYMFKPILCLSI